ncbi:MAG: CRISPR-associated endoribonuclease Cas6 [Hyphomicrobiales bacterium]
MRFLITLEMADDHKNILPMNNKYEFSSWFYKIISQSNIKFKSWLKSKGYNSPKQFFNNFTFSDVNIPHGFFRVFNDRIIVESKNAYIYLSFLSDKIDKNLILDLFLNKRGVVGDEISQIHFKVSELLSTNTPNFINKMKFRCISPIVVSKPALSFSGHIFNQYLNPSDNEFETQFKKRLLERAKLFFNKPFIQDDISINVGGRIQKKGITFKAGKVDQTKIIGHKFNFEIEAPVEIIKSAYYSGFGEMTSHGFGCCETF